MNITEVNSKGRTISTKRKSKRNSYYNTRFVGTMFALPAILLVLLFQVIPIINTLINSLYKYNVSNGIPKRFIGIDNYIRLLSEGGIVSSIKITVFYSFFTSIATMFVGILLAFMLNRDGFVIKILRGAALMPMLICGAVLSTAWLLIYSSSFGFINSCLVSFFGITGPNWLGDINITIYSLMLIEIWQFSPFVMILSLAGLQSIDPQLFEAASIDGASGFQRILHIALPCLKNILLTVFLIRLIDAFKTFEKPFLLTQGGPAETTMTLNLFVYKQAFISWENGLGSAGAVITAFITAVLAIILIRVTFSKEKP